jgi:hypothetical protein
VAHFSRPKMAHFEKTVDSTDGLHFTKETSTLSTHGSAGSSGSDFTVLRHENGTWYAYYRDFVGGVTTGVRGVYTLTSNDGLNWSTSPVFTGISSIYLSVPCAVELPDGRVRLIYCGSVGGGPRDPGILSAISSDWTNFQVESGVRMAQGPYGTQQSMNNPFFVDPEMALQTNNQWLLLFSSGIGNGLTQQKIYFGSTSDGLTWTPNTTTPLIDNGSGNNAFDPTAVPLGDGSFRIYYSGDVSSNPGTYFLRSGVIRPN